MQALLFIVFMLLCPAASADIYKWTDANGQVHFGDQCDHVLHRLVRLLQRRANISRPMVSALPSTTSKPTRRQGKNTTPFAGGGVPVILVGKQRINGFDTAGFDRMHQAELSRDDRY